MRIANLLVLMAIVFATQQVLAQGGGSQEKEKPQHSGAWNVPESERQRANPVAPTAESIRAGKRIFQNQCMACHGARGKGDGPAAAAITPPPADLTEHAGHHAAGDWAWRIRKGRGPMPGFENTLSDREIWHVLNYVRHELAGVPREKSRQAGDGHEGHAGHGGHEAHMQEASHGPWSYINRDNPEPHPAGKRWEMVPVPGYGHMFITTHGVSDELRCAALLNNPRVMVDRATREACGDVPPPARVDNGAGPASESEGHHGHHGHH